MKHPDRAIMILLLGVVFISASCANHQEAIKAQVDRLNAEARFTGPLPPKPFESDGCSLWWNGDWVDCCVDHDLGYWMGGTCKERDEFDLRLRDCVAAKGHPFMADVMYLGVRVGGVSWLPTPFRWGFGWEYPQSGPPGKPNRQSARDKGTQAPS
jgi:hypothetical protein